MGRNVNDLFESKYLKHGDFPDPRVCTMGKITDEDMTSNKGEDVKPVLHFRDAGMKSMVLNRTNAAAIAEVHGGDTDGWDNKQMEVYADLNVTNPQGQRVGGIRMRKPPRASAESTTGFGAAPVMTWEQAKTAANAAGVTYDDLVASLKANGRPGWNPARDTALVREIIAARSQAPAEQAFDADVSPPDDGVPF